MSAENAPGASRTHEDIRILLADDHVVMRAGTRRILDDEPDFHVIGEAGDGYEALALMQSSQADVVILDIAMPNLDGIRTCKALREQWPDVHILILTGHDNGGLVRTLLAMGVDGYLLKSASAPELIGAIRTVYAGGQVYSADASRALRASESREVMYPSRRELQVLQAVARGLKNREVAHALHMSENTVEYHLRNLFAKLHATSRTDALMRAQRLGWLDNEEPLC